MLPRHRGTILVLEDDPGFLEVLTHFLSSEGYAVTPASSGLEAIEKAGQEAFDLVVVDVRMEGIDGLEALASVRERQPEARSLVMTGYASEADTIRAVRMGVGDYLRKPFSLDEFLHSVGTLMAERAREQARRQSEAQLYAVWLRTTEALAGSLDRALLEVGQVAQRLAQSVGMSPEAAVRVRLAALIAALQAHGVSGVLGLEDDSLPEELARGLRHLDENWDGSGGPQGLTGEAIPLEARLVAVAQASAKGQPLTGTRFDPNLVELLTREPSEAGTDPARLRSLVSLGRALAEAGQREGAERAFQELLRLASPMARERLEALLGLARLAGGDRALCAQAVELAQKVGPGSHGLVSLECGLMLADADYLETATALLLDLRLPGPWARACLASQTMGRGSGDMRATALQVLLQPENAAELASSASWLVPFLRQWPADALVERALTRLGVELDAGPPDLLSQGGAIAPPAPASGYPTPPLLRIYSLGAFEVYRPERVPDASWRSGKYKHLMAYLAAHSERPVVDDVLIEEFWPDEDLEKARRSLHWCTSLLRRCLRPPQAAGELQDILRAGGGLQLNPQLPRWHDLTVVEGFLARGKTAQAAGHDSQAVDAFRQAIALYRGPYLEGCYQDWALRIRARLDEQVGLALSHMMSWSRQQQRHQEALEHAQRLIALDSCRQEAHLVAVQSLTALGRSEEAVRQYAACARSLRQLQMEPSLALVEAHQRALLNL